MLIASPSWSIEQLRAEVKELTERVKALEVLIKQLINQEEYSEG